MNDAFVTIVIAFLCALGPRAFADVVTGAPLESADPIAKLVSDGVKHSLTIENSQLTLRQTENTRKTTYTKLLPDLSLSGGKSRSTADSVSGTSISPVATDSSTLSATASWTLWNNNFQNYRDIKSANIDMRVARVNTIQTLNTYILGVVNAALGRQLAIDNRQSLKELLEQSKKTREQSDLLVKAGAKTRFEAMDAEIEVVNNERDLMESETKVAAAERALRLALNVPENYTLPEFNLLSLTPYFVRGFDQKLSSFRKSWLNEFDRVNPSVVSAKLGLDKSRITLTSQQLAYFPNTGLSISQSWDYGRYVQSPTDGAPVQALATTTVALTFTWELWDWFATHRSVQNAEMDYQISANTYLDTYRTQKSTVQDLFEAWDIAQRSIEATELVLKKAEQQLEYSREMYRIGRITLLEMQQASGRLFTARTELATRLQDKYNLIAQILSASGEVLLPAGLNLPWLPARDVPSASQ